MAVLYIKAQTRTYCEEVPEELKFSRNITSLREFKGFCVKICKNLKVAARLRGIPDIDVDEVVNEFVAHMLDTSKKADKPRYQTYDQEQYPDMQYFKWFLHNFTYFCKNYHNDRRHRELHQVSIVVKAAAEDRNVVSLESIFSAPLQDFTEEVEVRDLFARIKAYSEQAQKSNTFSALAYDLLQSRVLGEPNKDFCARKGIKQSRASAWAKQLHEMVQRYLQGKVPVFSLD